MIQQAYKYVRSSSWSYSMSFDQKVTKILARKEWVSITTENFYGCECVACRTDSLPSFNAFCYKLTEIAIFIYLMKYLVE